MYFSILSHFRTSSKYMNNSFTFFRFLGTQNANLSRRAHNYLPIIETLLTLKLNLIWDYSTNNEETATRNIIHLLSWLVHSFLQTKLHKRIFMRKQSCAQYSFTQRIHYLVKTQSIGSKRVRIYIYVLYYIWCLLY